MKIVSSKLFKSLLLTTLYFVNTTYADSYEYNFYNNYGIVGLIHTPSARFYDEGVHGVTIYGGTPNQTVTLSSNPYDWFEASFFYTNVQGRPYCYADFDEVCEQDFKDKGFNVKFRLKEEGILPAIAVGLNDFAGTGIYSSEYIVGSYGINKTDFHFGLGFGLLNGSDAEFRNPLTYLSDSFLIRPSDTAGLGGSFQPSRYFSGETASPFFGLSHAVSNKLVLKAEYDSSVRPGLVPFRIPKNDYNFGFDYVITNKLSVGLFFERGDYASLKFVYKENPIKTFNKSSYKKPETDRGGDDKYFKLIQNLEENGIGVKRITETSRSIGLELTQFIHPNMRVVEEIIAQSSKDAGIIKNIKTDIDIANLRAVTELDDDFKRNSELIYERKATRAINTQTGVQFRPFLASREEFFKGALLVENNTEFILGGNLFFNTNLKYSLADNLDDLIYPPVDTFPAQVRSDVKQYLKNIDTGVIIGRAQLDYHLTPLDNHHIMLSGGILEDMFSGAGMEYLFFKPNTNYSFGFELFHVRKRDYEWRFGHLDYENTTATANFYYRNYGTIPFDMKVSAGEYLAGDEGYTIEFSRSFINGVQFGAFATFTDVNTFEFGEGSFDKGIFFNIPIYGNLINYTWKPLTKDPGARLVRKNTLYDLLVKFRPIN